MSAYDVIYLLKPHYETEPNWWKLRWSPIWRHTFSFYRVGYTRWWNWGIRSYRCDANNGWGRSYSHWFLDLELAGHSFMFWIRWNFIVHKDGPLDVAEENKRPLELP